MADHRFSTNSHQIVWNCCRKLWADICDDTGDVVVRLTYAYSSDSDTISRKWCQRIYRLLAKLFEEASLDDREKHAFGVVVLWHEMFVLSLGPAMRDLHLLMKFLLADPWRRTHIEHHHDIRTEVHLDIDASLWREKVLRTIMNTTKFNSFFGDLREWFPTRYFPIRISRLAIFPS